LSVKAGATYAEYKRIESKKLCCLKIFGSHNLGWKNGYYNWFD